MTNSDFEKLVQRFPEMSPRERVSELGKISREDAQRLTVRLAELGYEPAVNSLREHPIQPA